MNNNPLISVIVPIYNVEQYLVECLDSLHNQKYQNLEILLIDDGSTDGSAKICEKYVKMDNRFHYYYKENSGLSGARNFALDRCHGDYVSFVDGDDFLLENCYSKIVDKLSFHYDIIQFGFFYGTSMNSHTCKFLPGEFDSKSYLKDFLLNGPDTVWCRVFSAKLFKDIRFKEGIIKEDTYIMPYLLKESGIVLSLEDCYYFYRQREGSIMNRSFTKKFYDTMTVYEQIMRVCEFDKELYSIAVARSIVAMAGLYSQFINDKNFSKIDKLVVKFKGREYLSIYKKVRKDATIKFSYRIQILLFALSPRLCSFVLHRL